MGFTASLQPEAFHTAIRVQNMAGMVQFYTNFLGLPVLRTFGDPVRPESVLLPGLQLVQAENQDIREKGVLDHLALGFTDLRAVVANLAANDIPLETPLTERRQPNGSALLLAFCRDPEGNLAELLQRG